MLHTAFFKPRKHLALLFVSVNMMKITILSILLFCTAASLEPQWKLAVNKDGIKVYLANAENSKIKQFKATAFINASPAAISAAVCDLENNYKWFDSVEKAKLLSRKSANDFEYTQIIKVPFPLDNRLMVSHCLVKKLAGGAIRLEIKETDTEVANASKYVRMPMMRGYWQLTPENGGTQIEYSFIADPGGSVPAWLTNQFIADGPYKTLSGLRKYLGV